MLSKAVLRVWQMVRFLAADPGQIKYLPGWVRTLRRSTLESRLPWLPYRVLDRLESVLDGNDVKVFEFGGGGSTVWFSDHRASVTTIEHDEGWLTALREALADQPRVTLRLGSASDDFEHYVRTIEEETDGTLDVIVVDGRERVRCFMAAIPKVAPGGLLILDDTDRTRYQPAFEAVSWPFVTYRGLTPSKTLAGVTTVWQRPAS